jgi:hypothetical protein
MVNLNSRLVSTDFGTWSYRCLLSNFTLIIIIIIIIIIIVLDITHLKCSVAYLYVLF